MKVLPATCATVIALILLCNGENYNEGVFIYYHCVSWSSYATNTFTDQNKMIIMSAMEEIASNTCIVFVERTDEVAYVNVQNTGDGCWASAGYTGGPRNLKVPPYCLYHRSTSMHEFMHSLGFHHEQTRYDRDLYVEVQWENIEPGQSHNFIKYPRTMAYPVYTYDFTSLMQYELRGFGIDRRPTLVLASEFSDLDEETVGWAKTMSLFDIFRIRSAYKHLLHQRGTEAEDGNTRNKGADSKRQLFLNKNIYGEIKFDFHKFEEK